MDVKKLKDLVDFMLDDTPLDAMSTKEREKRRKDLYKRIDTGKIKDRTNIEDYILTEI
jgi:hypothetical protein